MKPPYSLTPEILNLCTQIEQLVGQYEGLKAPKPQPLLRRKNRIKSIQSSLAIEGNQLSEEQVSAILENKKVIGPERDILEVKNAIHVYDQVKTYRVHSEKSFLKAHSELMKDLVPDAGKWRRSEVGVMEGKRVIHMGPKALFVPRLMQELFEYFHSEKQVHALIMSSILHYEIEFIHPFSDGNGRMGRFWQHAILVRHHPLFEYLPFESVIKNHQKKYYDALRNSDHAGNSNSFIIFCLKTILESLQNFLEELKPEPLSLESRLELSKNHFGKKSFSRKDYRGFFKTISTATASRDLRDGVERKILKKTGEKALAVYIFVN